MLYLNDLVSTVDLVYFPPLFLFIVDGFVSNSTFSNHVKERVVRLQIEAIYFCSVVSCFSCNVCVILAVNA